MLLLGEEEEVNSQDLCILLSNTSCSLYWSQVMRPSSHLFINSFIPFGICYVYWGPIMATSVLSDMWKEIRGEMKEKRGFIFFKLSFFFLYVFLTPPPLQVDQTMRFPWFFSSLWHHSLEFFSVMHIRKSWHNMFSYEVNMGQPMCDWLHFYHNPLNVYGKSFFLLKNVL